MENYKSEEIFTKPKKKSSEEPKKQDPTTTDKIKICDILKGIPDGYVLINDPSKIKAGFIEWRWRIFRYEFKTIVEISTYKKGDKTRMFSNGTDWIPFVISDEIEKNIRIIKVFYYYAKPDD